MRQDEILNHYKDNFDKNLSNDKLLDWESRDAQFARFKIVKDVILDNGLNVGNSRSGISPINLTENDTSTEHSLLDVGCGLADLSDYLSDNGIKINYTGIDILPQMITLAQKQHPSLRLLTGDIFADDILCEKFDIVYSSGIFNIDLGNNYEFLSNAVRRFIDLSNKYVVFNLLSDTSLDKETGYFYFNKTETDKILQTLDVSDYRIITGYLHNDMSVVIIK